MEGAMWSDMEIDEDRLSELPRPLLDHVLSFLPLDDVINISVLAKKWRNIWRTVPYLNFPYANKEPEEAVACINESLLLFSGSEIRKLYFSIKGIDKYAGIVDSWIRLALSCEVNELCLEFHGEGFLYNLLDLVFSSRALTCLSLRRCCVNMPSSFKLSSLRILRLERVKLTDEVINSLVSASSVLEELYLTECFGFGHVGLCIMNVSVKTLKIYDECCSLKPKLTVNAPHITSFELITSDWESFSIKGMFSLKSASFNSLPLCPSLLTCPDRCQKAIGETLESIRHVNDLRLNTFFIQALSIMGEEHIGSLSISVTCLVMSLGLTKRELPGIAYILRHWQNIETLVINVENLSGSEQNDPSECGSDLHDLDYWKLQEADGIDILQNLKTVKIYNFMKNVNLTRSEFSNTSNQELLQKLQNDVAFLRFILKNSKGLERMIIRMSNDLNCWESKSKKANLLDLLTKELQGYPRASLYAEVKLDYAAAAAAQVS